MNRQRKGNRSFRWGADPLFSRGLLLAPPTLPRRPTSGRPRRSLTYAREVRPRVVAGVVISALLHGGLILWSTRLTLSTDGVFGLHNLRTLASADPMQMVEISLPDLPEAEPAAPASAAVSENAIPIASPEPPRLTVRHASSGGVQGELMQGENLRVPPGLGRGVVAGVGTGTGAGDGADDAPDTYIAPRARSILTTWRPPPSVYGSEVLARVYTDQNGRPVGQAMLINATGHAETDQEILYRIQNLEYWPALVNGEAAAAWAEVTFEFCYHGTTAASPPSPGFRVGEPCQGEDPAVLAGTAADTTSGTVPPDR